MNKERLSAITDGIVAIAATIMVLELSVPGEITVTSLIGEWNTFVAYIVSFIIVYLSWYAHHSLVETINKVSSRFFLINGLWLFFITLIPFVTALIGKDINNSVAMFSYVIVNFLLALSLQLLSYQGIKDNPEKKDNILLSGKYVIIITIINIISLVLALTYPIFSLFIEALMTIYLGIDLVKKA